MEDGTMFLRLTAVLLVAVAALVSACVGTRHVLIDPSAPRLAPIPADSVAIYGSEAELDSLRFVRVALIDASASGDFVDRVDMLEAMRKEAAKLGANGIIISGIEEPPPAARMAAAVFGVETERRGSVVAVRVLGRKSDAH
jgi:hypothetical protein